jgi:hypothetical protein
MTSSAKLAPEYCWRQELDQHTLYLAGVPIVRVEPLVHGLIVRSLIHAPNLQPLEVMVATVPRGKALAIRWTAEREALIHKACSEAAAGAKQDPSDAVESPSISRWMQN